MECESSAARARSPKRRIVSAPRTVIAAMSAAEGSGCTWVSQTKIVPRGMISAVIAAGVATPGCSPTTSITSCSARCQRPIRPQIMPSASPCATISAAITTLRVRTMVRAPSTLTPLRPRRRWYQVQSRW